MATILEMLLAAKSRGVAKPRIKIGLMTYSLAPDNGANAGCIYVKASGEYCGKVSKGGFYPTWQYRKDDALCEQIAKHCADPIGAVIQHGRQFGNCSFCGRTLMNGVSIAAMIGPICAEKYGIDQYMQAVANGYQAPKQAISMEML